MLPFTVLTGIAAPLEQTNVDTDRIIPARFLTKPRAGGLAAYAFHDLRFDESGAEKPDFPLNQPAYRGAPILVADDNFGCGSSRESAVWALADLGIRSIIAPSFGDIFFSNCCKNGLLPVRLDKDVVGSLRATLHRQPGVTLTVDLPRQQVVETGGARVHGFEIDPFAKACLIEALDEIALTLKRLSLITAYESRWQADSPWAVPPRASGPTGPNGEGRRP